MSTIAAPEQDMLPLDFGLDVQILVPVYDEQARMADRQLCRRYLNQWAGSFSVKIQPPRSASQTSRQRARRRHAKRR
jgi:hypothetical protein